VLQGELVLVEDGGETVLRAGDAAAFPKGSGDGHHLINRSDGEAVVLEVGTRDWKNDACDYPDIDMLADEQGYLRISGRAKDVILRGGENLSAKEIEDLLFEHPEVDEVAVVGYPDDVLGERSCAVVVAARPLELADLVEFLRARSVANQKLPERLVQVEALPKTASGKVQKYRLRELVRDGEPA